jgi:hypothetical protein
MHRILRALAVATCLLWPSTVLAAGATAPGAPAERPFGRLKLTIVEVRRGLDGLTARAVAHPGEAPTVYARAVLLEDALRDWARHFPSDPWIPGCAFALAQLYGQLDLPDAETRKNDALDWLIAAYPRSDYAQMGRI